MYPPNPAASESPSTRLDQRVSLVRNPSGLILAEHIAHPPSVWISGRRTPGPPCSVSRLMWTSTTLVRPSNSKFQTCSWIIVRLTTCPAFRIR